MAFALVASAWLCVGRAAASDGGRELGAGEYGQVTAPWSGTRVEDLHQEYFAIFPSGNRNAASHLWSRFLLERSAQMTRTTFETMFSGFCPVSGSPVTPSGQNRYKLTLDRVDGAGTAEGIMYFCCWPCFCDTKDLIKVDTKRVVTEDGESSYRFAVIGDPCLRPEKLLEEHRDPFGRGNYTLATAAPDLRCHDGLLQRAALSDHGHVIIGLLHDVGSEDVAADDASMSSRCAARAQAGYDSGMGTIFRLAAGISPVVPGRNASGYGLRSEGAGDGALGGPSPSASSAEGLARRCGWARPRLCACLAIAALCITTQQ